MDDRKSLSIAFLAISDQCATLIFNFFVTKWLLVAILDDRKSLSIEFLAISYQYATFFFIRTKWMPAAILDDRKSPSKTFLPISDQYATFFVEYFLKMRPFWKSDLTIGFFHYVLSMAMPNMKLIGEFMTRLETSQAF